MSLHGRAPDTLNAGITSSSTDVPILPDSLLSLLYDSVDYSVGYDNVRIPVLDFSETIIDQPEEPDQTVNEGDEPITPIVSRKNRKRIAIRLDD